MGHDRNAVPQTGTGHTESRHPKQPILLSSMATPDPSRPNHPGNTGHPGRRRDAPDDSAFLGRARARVHEIVFEADTTLGRAFDIALIIAILTSVVVIMLSTLEWAGEHRGLFFGIEWALTGLFTIEYITRLCVVKRPLRYAFSFFGIIDLLSILPAFLGLFIVGGEELMVVRTLRLLRVFRVFKLARYLSEARSLHRALWMSRQKIAVFLTTVLIIVVITSALMHIVEGNSGNERFATIPDSMYWTIITLTTVGYGDVTPETPLGKLIAACLVLLGYSLIIVPTGILSAELTADFHRSARGVSTQHCRHCSREGHEPDAKFCKHCGEALGNHTHDTGPESATTGHTHRPDDGSSM